MKKIIVASVLLCGSLFADGEECVTPSNALKFYGGLDLVTSWTSSKFNMDYAVDAGTFDEAKPYANHKKNGIGNFGVGIFAGIRKNVFNNWFLGAELNYLFSRVKHRHDFTQAEDLELDADDLSTQGISYINVKHGNELGLSLKFGRECQCCEVYGILGLTTKKVDIKYGLNDAHGNVGDGHGFGVNPSKRVYGLVLGLGASKKINERISCGLEYRYKNYGSAKKSVDCRGATQAAFNNLVHDISDRNFKVRSDKHELALRVTVNI